MSHRIAMLERKGGAKPTACQTVGYRMLCMGQSWIFAFRTLNFPGLVRHSPSKSGTSDFDNAFT